MSELLEIEFNRERLNAVRECRTNIVPFVGAGISCGCGLFSWKELLNALAQNYMSDEEIKYWNTQDCIAFADELVNKSSNESILLRRIQELFDKREIKLTTIPRIILQCFSPLIVTTNYDNVLELASVKSQRGSIQPILPCLQSQLNDAIQLNEYKLLKIHGSIEEASSMVFSSKQYNEAYSKDGIAHKYLSAIYMGKRILFLGCSLEDDLTAKLLKECRSDHAHLLHYAIVPIENNMSIFRKKNTLYDSLGILPIYYPAGDYDAVEKIMNYLSAGEAFTSLVEMLFKNVDIYSHETREKNEILLSIVSRCFIDTADKYAYIYDIQIKKTKPEEILHPLITRAMYQRFSIYELIVSSFVEFLELGCVDQTEAADYFKEQLSSYMLEESDITDYLEKHVFSKCFPEDIKEHFLTYNLTNSEIETVGMQLTEKLQYKSGMKFDDEIAYYLDIAKSFVNNVMTRLKSDILAPLLRNMGVMCIFFRAFEDSCTYSSACIRLIENSPSPDVGCQAFLASVYNNLAMAEGYRKNRFEHALKANAKDLQIKEKNNLRDLNWIRSKDFHATILKEINPFKAFPEYKECYEIKKERFLSDKSNECVILSLATTVFNIGLLAKDIGDIDSAYKLIKAANEIRFKYLSPYNKDYCSSINVLSELEIMLGLKVSSYSIQNAVEKRIDLPSQFSNTLPHSWYVCALYFYNKEKYSDAIEYIGKMRLSSKEYGTFFDLRQDIRGDILLIKSRAGLGFVDEASDILLRDEKRLIDEYGDNSYYLIELYRMYQRFVGSEKASKHNYLVNLYHDEEQHVMEELKECADNITQEIRSFLE